MRPKPLCDLHIHVGAAVAPHILWSIAHDQGFKLPVQTFWQFRDLVTAKPETVTQLLAEGSIPLSGSPQQAAEYLKSEQQRWSKVVRESNVKLD